MYPLLCSNTEQYNVGISLPPSIVFLTSSSRTIKGIVSLRDYNNAIYLLLVVESSISIWIFEHHIIGYPIYMIMYPVLGMTERGASLHAWFNLPANEASTYVSILLESIWYISNSNHIAAL